jgi:hypothetical protein
MGELLHHSLSSALTYLPLSYSPAAVEVGDWDTPTAHGIRGTISFSNLSTLVIDDFSYDGGGVGEETHACTFVGYHGSYMHGLTGVGYARSIIIVLIRPLL